MSVPLDNLSTQLQAVLVYKQVTSICRSLFHSESVNASITPVHTQDQDATENHLKSDLIQTVGDTLLRILEFF